MQNKTSRAIVIGGSMAGLITARILSEYFDQVTIIERDTLPDNPQHRNGVPQAHHLHTLLAHGQHLLNGLFPALDADLEAVGSPRVRWGLDTASLLLGGWIKRFDSGIRSNLVSRVTLEWIVRNRVNDLPNVNVITNSQVDQLLTSPDQSTVIGVHITSRTDKSQANEYADLIVDASGRSSKAPAWLESTGYQAPQETLIDAQLGYATRWYQFPQPSPYEWKTMLVQTRPAEKLYRGGGMFVVEDNRLVLTLIGANKDYPPTDAEGFLKFAKSLKSPIIYDIIKDLEPISPIYGYRQMENRYRHYEKLSRLPENFIVIGDAACAFNPVYGQGMTAAAIEAIELGKLLSQTDLHNLQGFSRKFQKRLAKSVQGAWIMATGEDLRYPDVIGANTTLLDRITHRYIDRFMEHMSDDEMLATAFFLAMNLAVSPAHLMHPKYLLRLLRHKLSRQRTIAHTVNPFEATRTTI